MSSHMYRGIPVEPWLDTVGPGSRHSTKGHRFSIQTVGNAVHCRYIDLPQSVCIRTLDS